MRDEIIDQMISDRLFLIAARQDTSLNIRDDEIEQALDNQIANIAGNFPTEEEFRAALAAEGLTIRELKKRYRLDVENQLKLLLGEIFRCTNKMCFDKRLAT